MRRITVSLDDALARMAEEEVAAGRAPSVSAWVADAIRAKAQARTELIADLEELEEADPTPPDVVRTMARVLGLSRTTVAKGIKRRRLRTRSGRAA